MRLSALALNRLLCTSLFWALPLFGAAREHASPGVVRYVVRTDPSWDRYTQNASPDVQVWFRSKIWRMVVFSPDWDQKLSWYPNAWIYLNLYAIYATQNVANRHPEWILRDREGNNLYIPWGCHDNLCPQYAANVADASYRRHWIRIASEYERKGYKGIWIDDVNLDYRVGNGTGKETPAVDRKTGDEMSAADWRRHIAEFTEQIRSALPNLEIVHNAIWLTGGAMSDADPCVHRELRSADYINIERGVTDSSLRGGNGGWSLRALLSFIDRVHELGPGVILNYTGDKTEYFVATYFLISSGVDAIGNQSLRPDRRWPGLDVALGDPSGRREDWKGGLIRRRFSRGVVLVNPPGSAPVRITLSAQFRRADGKRADERLTISPADGLILVGPVERGKSVDSAIQIVK